MQNRVRISIVHMTYIPRLLAQELHSALSEYPVVTVHGPRQAGKTTFVRTECTGYSYTNLEEPDTRARATSDPRAFLSGIGKPAILDEIQRVPELLSYIQAEVDETGRNGLFVLTGSHQLELGQAVSQSLAGRTAVLTLLPLSMEEISGVVQDEPRGTILRRGFLPRIIDQGQEPTRAYRSYFQTYVERDLRSLLMVRDLSKFETFMRLLAGRVGQLFVASSLATELGVSYKTVQEWVSLLEASYVAFLLRPYHTSFGKRLVKAPKLYFIEPGLACHLLGIEKDDQVERDPLFGGLFENLVVAEALKARLNRGKDPSLYFLRDSNGAEVDLVLDRRPVPTPIEIKSSTTYHKDFRKGLERFSAMVGEDAGGYVIYGGSRASEGQELRLVGYKDCARILA